MRRRVYGSWHVWRTLNQREREARFKSFGMDTNKEEIKHWLINTAHAIFEVKIFTSEKFTNTLVLCI